MSLGGTYATDGSLRVTVVDGSSRVPTRAADGSLNVKVAPVPVTANIGLYHSSGAINVTVASDTLDRGIYAADGSLYVTETLTNYNGPIRVTILSGSLGSANDHLRPTITSTSSVSIDENTTLNHSLTANESVTWTIVGGVDSGKLEISTATLRWTSNGTKDYELPDDSNEDNIYLVRVRATDAASNYAEQVISIFVDDVDESSPDNVLQLNGENLQLNTEDIVLGV